jgi:hypothetical protein
MPKQPSKLQQEINWYVSLLVLVLFWVGSPILCGLLYLSRVPEVMWQWDGPSYDRIWMYRERRPLGIAHQSQRVSQEYSPTEVCVENQLNFYLWAQAKEAQESITYHKMVRVGNEWQPTGEECN